MGVGCFSTESLGKKDSQASVLKEVADVYVRHVVGLEPTPDNIWSDREKMKV